MEVIMANVDKISDLKEGDQAPDFSLKDQSGQKVSLKNFKGQTVVLYFYPKDLTPGCTVEACDFRDHINQFKDKKAVILGVSKDSESSHQKFINKHNLNFSLLVDSQGQVCQTYRVLQTKKIFGKEIFNAIQRTTFLIAPDGKIQKIYRKVKVKGHVEQILRDLS